MSSNFPIDTAQIVGLFMEAVAYGIYLPTLFSCLNVLLRSDGRFKKWSQLNYTMLVAALGMFVFATFDVAFGLRHNIEAFVLSQEEPEETFEDISDWINVMKMADYVAQTFIGDSILVYRCFVIWDRRWLIILLPLLLFLAETACGAMTIYTEATLGTGALNHSKLVPFITSMLSLTLATNVLTTSLIVYRIWNVKSRVKGYLSDSLTQRRQNDPLQRAIRVMIESGLIYTLSIVILFCVYMSSSNASLGVSNTVVQIIGITFNLIIVNTTRNTEPSHGPPATANHVSTIGTGTIPMHMISIQTEVSRDPPLDSDSERRHSAMTVAHKKEPQSFGW